MATLPTRTVVMLAGLPSRSTLWNLCRRYPRLQQHLIRSQRRGSLWSGDAPDVAYRLFVRQRQWGPYRRRPVKLKPMRPARPTADDLARLEENIRAIVERRMKGTP